jgi:hypothetical protein
VLLLGILGVAGYLLVSAALHIESKPRFSPPKELAVKYQPRPWYPTEKKVITKEVIEKKEYEILY